MKGVKNTKWGIMFCFNGVTTFQHLTDTLLSLVWHLSVCFSTFPSWQILFERVTFDLEELREAIRIIDKDVPRTNRDLSYYQWVIVSFCCLCSTETRCQLTLKSKFRRLSVLSRRSSWDSSRLRVITLINLCLQGWRFRKSVGVERYPHHLCCFSSR